MSISSALSPVRGHLLRLVGSRRALGAAACLASWLVKGQLRASVSDAGARQTYAFAVHAIQFWLANRGKVSLRRANRGMHGVLVGYHHLSAHQGMWRRDLLAWWFVGSGWSTR